MQKLAERYEEGKGTPQDFDKACHWYKEAYKEKPDGSARFSVKKCDTDRTAFPKSFATFYDRPPSEKFDARQEWKKALEAIPPELMKDLNVNVGYSPALSWITDESVVTENSPAAGSHVKEARVTGSSGGAVLVNSRSYHLNENTEGALRSIGFMQYDKVSILKGLLTIVSLGSHESYDTKLSALHLPDYGQLESHREKGEARPLQLPSYTLERISQWEGSEGSLFPLSVGNKLRLRYVLSKKWFSPTRLNGIETVREKDEEYRLDVLFTVTGTMAISGQSANPKGPAGEIWILGVTEDTTLLKGDHVSLPGMHKNYELRFDPRFPERMGVGPGGERRMAGDSSSESPFPTISQKHRTVLAQQREQAQRTHLGEAAEAKRYLANKNATEASEREAEHARELADRQEMSQNFMNLLSGMAGVAVQGLQQSQALKQGIVPTVNIVPGQGMGETGMAGDPYGDAAAASGAFGPGVDLGTAGSGSAEQPSGGGSETRTVRARQLACLRIDVSHPPGYSDCLSSGCRFAHPLKIVNSCGETLRVDDLCGDLGYISTGRYTLIPSVEWFKDQVVCYSRNRPPPRNGPGGTSK
jgi:hypothetical protein